MGVVVALELLEGTGEGGRTSKGNGKWSWKKDSCTGDPGTENEAVQAGYVALL